MTDKEFGDCLRRIENGDRQAFRDLYTEYFGAVYSAALSVTCNKAAAEDVTSDFFVKLWTKKDMDFSDEKGGHKRWLAVCVKNLAINYIKKYKNEDLFSDGDENGGLYEESHEENVTSEALVSDALSKLTESEREIIHLKYYCGYTLREISRILGISLGQAAWSCRRSESKLRKIIGEVR